MASEEEELCPRLYGTLESFLTSHQQYEDSQALQEHMTLNRHWLAKLPNSNWSSNVSERSAHEVAAKVHALADGEQAR